MNDDGTRVKHGDNGAFREDASNKSRPDLISPLALLQLGEWAKDGANKYGDWNYIKGMPYSRYVSAIQRHLLKWQSGQRDECHLSAIAWNALALLHHELVGDLKWNDIPNFQQTIKNNKKESIYLTEEW